MEEFLNLSSWADDASSKTIEIYSAFIKKAILEDVDREKLKKERGFSDSVIDLCGFKSCRQENRELIKELQDQFGEDALLEAGLLEAKDDGIRPCFQLLGTFKDDKVINNICIPYFNSDGDIFYIRPHKYGLKNKGINLYVPVRNAASEKIWIITESEFKAAAAMQLGFPSIGLPGIHSFAVNNFDRLLEFITQTGIGNLVIIFDNEIKNNPAFKNFKPNILKQWDTQWRNVDMCRKLLDASNILSVKIGVLPASWMVEGKIDIDGALAQGRITTEFKSIIYNAMDWPAYLETLPPVAYRLIKKKIYREDYLKKCPVKKDDSGYVVYRKVGQGRGNPMAEVAEIISNFTMEIKKTLIEESGIHIREISVKGQDGTVSKPYLCKQGTNILRDFKSWVWGCGDYHFKGKQEDLDEIWKLEGALSDGRVIYRPEQIGHLRGEDCSYWLFGNAMIKDDGGVLLPDDEGIIWDGLTGYIPRSIKDDAGTQAKSKSGNKTPVINLDSNVEYGLPELKYAADMMETNFGTKAIRLAVGWIIACMLSEEIFKRYACFPILFIGGKREVGKSTLGNWLMAMAGQAEAAGDSISGASQAGAERNLSWYNSLPYWLDEYRNALGKKWDGLFRNAYQRQASSKGTLGNSIRSHNINAGILLSGEETPSDNALLTRCVYIPLTSRKSREDKINLELFKEIENLRISGILSRLMIEVAKLKKKIITAVLDNIDGWKERMVKQGVGDRVALNYAIPAVCYDAVFLKDEPVASRIEFTDWVVKESHKFEKEKENEHILAVFMDDLITLHEKLGEFYSIYETKEAKGKTRIALHYPTFYSVWSENFRKKGEQPFSRAAILKYIREEKYFVEDNACRRINGKTARALVLSLDLCDNPPDGLSYLQQNKKTEAAGSVSDAVKDVNDANDALGPAPEDNLDLDPPI